MRIWDDVSLLMTVSRAREIARRYFVTNGLDGALAMMGLTIGFYVGERVPVQTVLSACTGTAIALTMSGLSSAYMSESAERYRELRNLQEAMVHDLEVSAHARAACDVPWLIACVNGLAPLMMAMVIMLPLWLEAFSIPLILPALESSIVLAFVVIFFLGVFLGRVSRSFWMWSALHTTLIATVTAGLIFLLQM